MRVLFLMVLKINMALAMATAMVTAMVLIQMDILMRRNHGISMMQSRKKLQTKGKK
jgi:hypothetical protein